MNRRNFVKSLSAMGVSATSLSYLSQDALAQVTHDPKEEVPYVAYLRGEPPEREPVYKTIERDEWERRHTAINAGEKIHRKLGELIDSNLIEVGYQADDNSPTDFGVLVSYKKRTSGNSIQSPNISLEELEKKLPDKVSGEAGKGEYKAYRKSIPVTVEEEEVAKTSCMSNDKYWQDTPGGTPVDIQKTGMTDPQGTFCAPYYSYVVNSSGLITSGHLADSGDGIGAAARQDLTDIGTVKQYYNGDPIDYAFVERSSIDEWIAYKDNDGLDYQIYGVVTNSEIANNVGNDSYKLRTQGRATCQDEGKITYISTDVQNGNVRTAGSVDGGDSGPLYKVEAGKAYIAGVIRESYYFPDYTGSTTAEAVEDHYSGYWHTV